MSDNKEGTRYRFKKLVFFAVNGMCRMINEETGEEKDISPMELRLRGRAFAADAAKMKAEEWKYKDEIREMFKTAVNCVLCAQEAEKQGCPLDPEVARQQAQLRKKVKVSMSGAYNHKKDPTHYTPGGLYVPGGVD